MIGNSQLARDSTRIKTTPGTATVTTTTTSSIRASQPNSSSQIKFKFNALLVEQAKC